MSTSEHDHDEGACLLCPLGRLLLGVGLCQHEQQALCTRKSRVVGESIAFAIHSLYEYHTQFPKNLWKDGGYQHRAARFGRFPEAGSLTQHVYYADSDACQSLDPTKGYPKRPNTANTTTWHAPFILLVDQSPNCTFVKKVCVHCVGFVDVLSTILIFSALS